MVAVASAGPVQKQRWGRFIGQLAPHESNFLNALPIYFGEQIGGDRSHIRIEEIMYKDSIADRIRGRGVDGAFAAKLVSAVRTGPPGYFQKTAQSLKWQAAHRATA